MQLHRDEFTQRQVMNTPDFEFYYYLDPTPPQVDFHHHEFYEVFFFLSGIVRYTIEGRCYQLRPGDILLTNAWDIHRPEVSSDKPYERCVLWLSKDFLDKLSLSGDDLNACFIDSAKKKYKLIRPNGETSATLRSLYHRTLLLQKDGGFGAKSLLYAAITELLVYLNRAYFDTPELIRRDVTENDMVNQVVEYVGQHLTEPLSLDNIAATFHLSKYHLDRQFKHFTGLSLYQFIMKKRLLLARTLLQAGHSATDACISCGFGDYSNFLKAFKREFNCTPKAFQSGVK